MMRDYWTGDPAAIAFSHDALVFSP